jgi:hypothetical protein
LVTQNPTNLLGRWFKFHVPSSTSNYDMQKK